MRIDKFLWCVRYYKTRNKATIACKKGQIKVNNHVVKPGKEVYIDDIIELRKNQINYKLRIIAMPTNRVGAKLVDIYRIDITPKEAFEAKELLKYSKDYYRKKGMGRPTKKDRRSIESYIDEEE
ncbi:RNA-binding S4 domain-containing protein [Winogradskyella immobilis]|uniref:RNA-binding S4 domain-containing protein n=1 Tax=Winogradskyella immobilis TaxID=2816852 RepID=A0ABS8EP68_9FLAO|nr:S4 domain-containing protein [Winogradskyella immobilis]MCC1485020.1 RNA-binding S4 domain-containing protein [Winogradskyella immobilis]MCG0017112.1 RNA-binding S4 domain-containing protein [Winogradskyella immobilis]